MKILRIAVRFCLVFSVFAIALVFLPTSEAGQRPLSGDLKPRQVHVSEDENYIVFSAPTSVEETHHALYTVRKEGGAPRRIANNIYDFNISPDSRYVYYTEPLTPSSQATSLYFVPITGGTPTLVDSAQYGIIFFDGGASDWTFTPDGRFLIYMAWRDLDPYPVPLEFSRVAVGSNSPVLISDLSVITTNIAVGAIQISPDSTTLAYTGQTDDLVLHLVTIPMLGGPSHVLTAPSESARRGFAFTPDSQRIVYSTGTDPYDGEDHLYSSRVDGSDRVLLREGGQYSPPIFSANGASLLYGAIGGANGDYIYEQPVTGGAVVPRFGGPGFAINNGYPWIKSDPTGQYLLFYAQNMVKYLYSMPITPGGVAVQLSDSAPADADWQVTPDGQRVLYQFYYTNPREPYYQSVLYIAPIDGSTPTKYLYSEVYSYFISDDSTAIYFTEQSNFVVRLPLTGEETPTAIYSGDPTRRHRIQQTLSNDQLLLTDYLPDSGDTQLWLADDALSAVEFALPETFIEETDSVYTATVTLDAISLQAVTVDIVVGNGTATEGSDFTFTPHTLTFAPGDTEKSVPITILADEEADDGETIVLEARNIEGGTTGAALSTTITLRETVYRQWLPRITQ